MIRVLLQGFIIGIAKMIPGFSGSVLAIILGVYDKSLNIIAKFPKIALKELIYLLLLGIGIIFGIVLSSKLIIFLLRNIYFPIMLLIIGLILGSIREIVTEIKGYNKIKGLILFTLSSLLIMFIQTIKIDINLNINEFSFFFLGVTEIFTTLVPGISGTVIYLILNIYELMLDFYANIFIISNFLNLFYFILGLITGLIIISKILVFILKKHKQSLMVIILGFMFSSVCFLLKDLFNYSFNFLDLVLGILFLIIGYISSCKINHLF